MPTQGKDSLMPLTGQAKTDYQREYMRKRRSNTGVTIKPDSVRPVTVTVRPKPVRPTKASGYQAGSI